jgi:hypothetical protein
MTSNYFTYEKGKVLQALRFHFISRREIKIMIILVNIFAILSAIFFYKKMISPIAFLVSSFLWISMMVIFWYLLPRMIYRKNDTFKDHFKASFDNEDFTIENERGQRTWAWKELSTWLETPHFFHLYFNPRSFFIIPKAAFPGDDVFTARHILMDKVKK